MKVNIDNALATQTKTVAQLNTTSGRIYLPRKWVGKKVLVVLLDD